MEIITQLFKLVFELLEGILKFFFEAIELGFSNKKKEYNAEFASQ